MKDPAAELEAIEQRIKDLLADIRQREADLESRKRLLQAAKRKAIPLRMKARKAV